jgi:gas vesicle protein
MLMEIASKLFQITRRYNKTMSNEKNHSQNQNNTNSKDFFVGAILGGIVGAAAALLLAPKSGRELRSDLNSQALKTKLKTSDLTHTAYEMGTEFAAIAKEKTSTIAKTVTEQTSHLVDRVKELTENVKRDIEELNKSTEELTVDIQEVGIEIAEQVKNEVEELHAEVTNNEIVGKQQTASTNV